MPRVARFPRAAIHGHLHGLLDGLFDGLVQAQSLHLAEDGRAPEVVLPEDRFRRLERSAAPSKSVHKDTPSSGAPGGKSVPFEPKLQGSLHDAVQSPGGLLLGRLTCTGTLTPLL